MGSLTIEGPGSLSITGKSTSNILARNITINGATIDSNRTLYADRDLVINDSVVTVSTTSWGLCAMAGNITINGGYVDITGSNVSMQANHGEGEVTFASNMTVQAATSIDGALGEFVEENLSTYKHLVVYEECTVTFDAAGGSAVTAQTVPYGQKATKPADPTKEGYNFKGWTLNGADYDFSATVTGNITLKAKWEAKVVAPTTYTVTFAADGGSGTMTAVSGVSGEYTLPANGFTAPNGKQFKAWSVNGVEKKAGDKITLTADTTITAVWTDVSSNPTTGDNANLTLWMTLLVISSLGIFCLVLTKKKLYK